MFSGHLLLFYPVQELNLLRSTPAQQLLRVDALRAEACACRIQRLWRRIRGVKKVSQLDEDGARNKAMVGSIENGGHSVTAPEIFSRRCVFLGCSCYKLALSGAP